MFIYLSHKLMMPQFIAGELSLKVSLALYLPTGHYKL